ncbi:MAG: hypothetical protein LBV58_01265 [Acholeplasmatales bacterium]|jgi:predicted RNA-binding protein YlxR (DUF448 family)|nr:hypothetical protein [Acholeplasmatales bacterium]
MQIINKRTCLLTYKKLDLVDLVRLVVKENELILDESNILKQRGYYIGKKNIYSFELNKIVTILEKRTKKTLSTSLIEWLKNYLGE